jgi:hypothetical protein
VFDAVADRLEGVKSLTETRAAQRAALEQVEADEAEQARQYAIRMAHRAEVARLWERERSGFVEMELAGTALIGQVRAARELDDAVRLRDLLLSTRRLLEDGVLFVAAAELLLARPDAATSASRASSTPASRPSWSGAT